MQHQCNTNATPMQHNPQACNSNKIRPIHRSATRSNRPATAIQKAGKTIQEACNSNRALVQPPLPCPVAAPLARHHGGSWIPPSHQRCALGFWLHQAAPNGHAGPWFQEAWPGGRGPGLGPWPTPARPRLMPSRETKPLGRAGPVPPFLRSSDTLYSAESVPPFLPRVRPNLSIGPCHLLRLPLHALLLVPYR
jgi:hypothetical protein